jgi:hypothetical protein
VPVLCVEVSEQTHECVSLIFPWWKRHNHSLLRPLITPFGQGRTLKLSFTHPGSRQGRCRHTHPARQSPQNLPVSVPCVSTLARGPSLGRHCSLHGEFHALTGNAGDRVARHVERGPSGATFPREALQQAPGSGVDLPRPTPRPPSVRRRTTHRRFCLERPRPRTGPACPDSSLM